MATVALRMSHVWNGEVMEDRVFNVPSAITLGTSGQSTFTVPVANLPQDFAIVRPGNRGYLLTLGANMRGTICVDGIEQPVDEFVRKGAGGDSFHATPISGRDWGVIDLDDQGRHRIFFQFVPQDQSLLPFLSMKLVLAGLAGYLMTVGALGTMFLVRQHQEPGDAYLNAAMVGLVPLLLAWLVYDIVRSDFEQQAADAFSVILHACLLFWTYKLFDPNDDPNVFPGSRAMTGQYLVTRLEDPPPEEKPPPTVGAAKKDEPAAPKSPEKPNHAATKGAEGASGGKGDVERAKDKNARDDVKREAPKVAFFEDKNKKYLDNIVNRDLIAGIDKFNGLKADETKKGGLGFGPGQGTGVGEGNGTGTTRGSKNNGSGGNGFSDQDIVRSKGPIDTGKNRPGGNCTGPNCTGAAPKEAKVAVGGDTSGDFGGLTAEEIDRVVRARAGIFKACYQKELNHSPGLGGKLVIHFKIAGDGTVSAANTGGGSTLRNGAVESCVNGNVMRLKFPAKGGAANVNYPFVFSQGG